MHVCHFSSTSLSGHYFESMANGLVAAGDHITLASLRSTQRPAWFDQSWGGFLTLNSSARATYPRAVLRLGRFLRAQKVDVLHMHLFDASLVGLAAGWLAGTPVVCAMRHHTDEHWLLERKGHVWVDRAVARAAHHMVVPSNAVRAHMRDREAVRAPIEVVHIGFDFEKLEKQAALASEVREELKLGDAFSIACVGRLTPSKGVLDLIDALSALGAGGRDDVRVVLVGAGETGWIRERAVSRQVSDALVLTGYRDDAPSVMAACDVLAHPSHSDSFPQVLIEAMGVGTPVVASRVGGIPEIVDDGETGVLVAPHDPEALAAALGELRDDPVLRRSLGVAAGRAARGRFDAQEMVDRQLSLYRSWLGEARS